MAIKPVAKITDSDLKRMGLVSAPTVLNGTVEENKARFDQLVTKLVAPTVNAMIDNEKEIEVAEVNRGGAEQLRDQAEGVRATAEAARVAAEETRQTQEAQRVTAEDARVVAETARAQRLEQKEREHDAALNTAKDNWNRVLDQAEAQRTAAEIDRVAAEQARVSGESRRETQMEEILSVTQETVDNARQVQAAVKKTETIQTSVGLNRRWQIGPASLINELSPGRYHSS